MTASNIFIAAGDYLARLMCVTLVLKNAFRDIHKGKIKIVIMCF